METSLSITKSDALACDHHILLIKCWRPGIYLSPAFVKQWYFIVSLVSSVQTITCCEINLLSKIQLTRKLKLHFVTIIKINLLMTLRSEMVSHSKHVPCIKLNY